MSEKEDAVRAALQEFVDALDEKRAANAEMMQGTGQADRSFKATDRVWANLEPARTALAHPSPPQAAAGQEPIAKLHSDGYWTAMPGFREPLNFSSIEVYPAPAPQEGRAGLTADEKRLAGITARVRDWLGAGCTGEPPRPEIAVLASISEAVVEAGQQALAAAPEAAQAEVAADELADLRVEVERLRADYAKAERRAIAFGDIISNHCIAMQAAVIEQHAGGGAEGAMCWIANTLCGPGLLPDIDAAIELAGDGGQDRAAQAWFDAKTAEHEAFRAAHPGPSESDAALRQEKKG